MKENKKPKFYAGYAFDDDVSEEKREEYRKEREERGFDSTELWNLEYTLASYILPRLKAFRKDADDNIGYPCAIYDDDDFHEDGHEKWLGILDKMIESFQMVVDNVEELEWVYEDNVKFKTFSEGMHLFAKYFLNLWT